MALAKIKIYKNKWNKEEQRNEPGALVRECAAIFSITEEAAVSFVVDDPVYLTAGKYWLAVPNLPKGQVL